MINLQFSPFGFYFSKFFLKPIDKIGILMYIILDPHPVGVYGERKRKKKVREKNGKMNGRKNGFRIPKGGNKNEG